MLVVPIPSLSPPNPPEMAGHHPHLPPSDSCGPFILGHSSPLLFIQDPLLDMCEPGSFPLPQISFLSLNATSHCAPFKPQNFCKPLPPL